MKNIKIIIAAIALAMLMFSCSNDENVISKPEIGDIPDGKLTAELLWSFGRLGEFAVSPDEQLVAFTVTYYDIKANKGNTDIYLMDIDGQNIRRFTKTEKSEYNLVWLSKYTLAYLYGGKIYKKSLNQDKAEEIDGVDGLEGFKVSPNGYKILFARCVPSNFSKADTALFDDLDKTSGRVIEDLAYRHWDSWVDEVPHLYVADFDTHKVKNEIDLLEGTYFEAPTRPWGGMEETDWSPDSRKVAYTCRKKVGKDYAFSTNSDIYIYDTEKDSTINISSWNLGYDKNPRFSNDGKFIAWESMERDGYEADHIRPMVMRFKEEVKTKLKDTAKGIKEVKEVKKVKEVKISADVMFMRDSNIVFSENFYTDITSMQWGKGDSVIYFIAPWQGRSDIFAWHLTTNEISRITDAPHEYLDFQKLKKGFIGSQMSTMYPAEIFSISESGVEKNISNINTDLLAKLDFGKVEERLIKSSDGKDVRTFVIFPRNFDPNKKYPTLLFCEGGPQSMTGYFWSYRWNFQMMAANEYVIVAPARRGASGYGVEWCEQISGDYGGQCMNDLFAAIDALAKEPYVDETRLGCTGASFGGFTTYWMMGHHNKRFKAFLAHNGMFNFEQQYLETEEMWFEHWDLGGPFWDKSDKKSQKSHSFSPHLFIDKWDSPLCVVHSEFDYRIVASQGMAAFNAAQIKGLPSRYLYFPDESHWVLQPQNSILWHRNFIDWFDTYLK